MVPGGDSLGTNGETCDGVKTAADGGWQPGRRADEQGAARLSAQASPRIQSARQGAEMTEVAVTHAGAPACWRSRLAASPLRNVRNAAAGLSLGGGP